MCEPAQKSIHSFGSVVFPLLVLALAVCPGPFAAGPAQEQTPAEPAAEPAADGGERGELQATSLLGRELYSLHRQPGTDIRDPDYDALHQAQKQLFENPDDPESWISMGIAYSESWRYRDAIEAYTKGLEEHPKYALLYRHRGHRYLSVREFDRAVADLNRAAQLEPDDFDIWYHLGLARYLQGELDQAAVAYSRCREVIDGDDDLVAVSHWLYMTLRRAGKEAAAQDVLARIGEEMAVEENRNYYDLLLFYKGLRSEEQLLGGGVGTDSLEFATIGYGIGNWHLYHGRQDRAVEIFERIVAGHFWPAFGFIAAEADLARLHE